MNAAAATYLEPLKRVLFEGREAGSVYAILDGASVPELPEKLQSAKEHSVCLFRGDLTPDVARVAPYLVNLSADSEFTNNLISEGWGKHWGVFVIANIEIHPLRRHFRKFLRVQDPVKDVIFFRYYDPRVLSVYLPTCNYEEIKTIYGPVVQAYITEGSKDQSIATVWPWSQLEIKPVLEHLFVPKPK